MTSPNPPPRWLEQPDELPVPLSRALAAYRDRAPSATECDAVFASLQARLSTEGTPVAASKPRWLRRLWLPTALGVIAAVFMLLPDAPAPASRRVTPSQPAVSVTPSAAAPFSARAPEGTLRPAAEAAPPSAPSPATEITANSLPAPVRARASTRQKAAAPDSAAARASLSVSDPAAELALLTPARRVLSSSPARSLELIAEHARKFPRGTFAEERDLLRIEALLRSGQREDAARHAASFRRSHPNSAHLEHLSEIFAP